MIYKYKRNLNDLLKGFAILSVFGFLVLLKSSVSFIYACVIWFLIIAIPFFIIYFLLKRLVLIQIDESTKELNLIFEYFIFYKIEQSYLVHELKYSFKEKVGARMIRYKELEIFHNDKKIINIRISYEGWNELTILKIITRLKKSGIEEI
jgi:hypothetical protein